jgi:copper chaperone
MRRFAMGNKCAPQPLQKGCGVLLCALWASISYARKFAPMLYSESAGAACAIDLDTSMLTLNIPAISCDHCARIIRDTVLHLDPAAVVQVDVAAHTAAIETSADPATVLHNLAEEGYPATPA